MTKLRTLAAMAVGVLTGTLGGFEADAQPAAPVEARNVVLVHGAWADGSSWAEVIPRLQAAGVKVTAVQNPLTSLADSVAATRRALALQDSSPFPGSFLLGQCVQASRNTMVSPIFRRRLFFDLSRTVSSARKQKSFMPSRSPLPPLCSANERQRLPGTPNRHGMPYRNSMRR